MAEFQTVVSRLPRAADPVVRGGAVMLSFGGVEFGAPASRYACLRRRAGWRRPSQDRIGRHPARQFTGPGPETIELEGVICPISANLFSISLFPIVNPGARRGMREDWAVRVSFLLPGWRELARPARALKGLRKDKSAEKLPRVLLLHLGGGHSFRETVVRILLGAGSGKRHGIEVTETVFVLMVWRWLNVSPIAMSSRTAPGLFIRAKKDASYDFPKREDVDWRKFNLDTAKEVYEQQGLGDSRVKAFVLDASVKCRRGRKMEDAIRYLTLVHAKLECGVSESVKYEQRWRIG